MLSSFSTYPLCCNSRIEISANFSYKIGIRPFDKLPTCFQAELHISSRPLGGVVYFTWTLIEFPVNFRDQYKSSKKWCLGVFVKACLKKYDKSPIADYILSLRGRQDLQIQRPETLRGLILRRLLADMPSYLAWLLAFLRHLSILLMLHMIW